VEIQKKMETQRPTRQIAATGPDGRLYYARRYDPNTQTVTGLKVMTMQGAVVAERLDAERAQWDGRHWQLHQGTRRRFVGDEEVTEVFTDHVAEELAITPRGLYRTRVRPEQMNIRQLIDHRDLLRQTGGDTTAMNVDIQFQLAFPLVNLIVVFLGVVLASGPRKTTIASGFGTTLLIGFGYYVLMMFGRSLGHNGLLSPVAAGWAGNAVYALLAVALFVRARR
jgi:lipopolysaccharide export system permease protein